MPVATAILDRSTPKRHALVVPDDCDCGLCGPTWAARPGKSRRFSQPVTLAAALEGEEAACRADMVRQHRERLSAMVCAAEDLLSWSPMEDPVRPGVGLGLVMFAGELASAIRAEGFGSELPPPLRADCERTVTAAMFAAAGCLTGLVVMYQSLMDTVGS